jgi:hypothetical protein
VKRSARVLAVLLLSVTATNFAFGQSKATGGPTPSPEGARVYFVDVKEGAVIAPRTTVHFGLHGMGVAPAGSDKANSGHHHLLVDTDLPPLDEPIPSDFNHIHFGAGQTEVDLTLAPGPHTLQLLLGDKNHIPHSPPVMSERIHVVVAGAPSAPAVPAPSARHTSPPDAKAYIISPDNGAAVPLTLLVRFGLDKMTVVRAGVETPDSGHHHLLIDAPLPPFDEPIPNDENHLHFGAGQTEATITLTPGKHTLQLLLGDANHVPHAPPVFSTPITVFAGDAPRRKTCNPGETLDSSGVCAPRETAQTGVKPSPRSEVAHRRRRASPPVRAAKHYAPMRERPPAPGPSAPGEGQGFNDLRPCPPGTHSQSAPVASGYRCMPNS